MSFTGEFTFLGNKAGEGTAIFSCYNVSAITCSQGRFTTSNVTLNVDKQPVIGRYKRGGHKSFHSKIDEFGEQRCFFFFSWKPS